MPYMWYLCSVKCSESLDLRDQLHAPAAKCHDETHLYSGICTQQHLLQCDSHSNDVTQTPSIITPNRQRWIIKAYVTPPSLTIRHRKLVDTAWLRFHRSDRCVIGQSPLDVHLTRRRSLSLSRSQKEPSCLDAECTVIDRKALILEY